ncbi:MAG: tRNA (adenosine(37)-N6)-dimethylallyltransferase MiaA [Bacteroidaceae bacterium]|nr:tRNA (adenosine(37)-N6)-dimethylallyltransferase MiaA [Bacteroidaceae bacterium]
MLDCKKYDLISIIGPTASGKTALAVEVARAMKGEILSADSRQVYRGMDIGTGKDIAEYGSGGTRVPYHLIDIFDAGEKYNLFEFQRDFLAAYSDIVSRGALPVMCGGSGLYVESVLKGYRLIPVPENCELRARLEGKSMEELTTILATYKKLHNTTDVDTKKRAIRAIEIEEHYARTPAHEREFPLLNSLIVGVDVDRDVRRERISRRLRARIDEGLVDEVRALLEGGLSPEQLIYYGLEYKYVTLYLTGALGLDDMIKNLETAIHQFAKRQMTWFRGMERRGLKIKWIDVSLPLQERVGLIKDMYNGGCTS